MQGNYLQQMTSAGDIFRYIFFGAIRDNKISVVRVTGLKILGRVHTTFFYHIFFLTEILLFANA